MDAGTVARVKKGRRFPKILTSDTLPSQTMKIARKFILVVCGHPCSGKTGLTNLIKSSRHDVFVDEMDDIRLVELPDSNHDEPVRSAAYRLMHFRATKNLGTGPVLVSATYQPFKHREEIANLALRFEVPMYVVQCVCRPEEAERRFMGRGVDHAGNDLTASRVRQIAADYERFDGALTLNTDILPLADQVKLVLAYIEKGPPVDPTRWARHYYQRDAKSASVSPRAGKISEASVRRAKWRLGFYTTWFFIFGVSTLAGLLPLGAKVVGNLLDLSRGLSRDCCSPYRAAQLFSSTWHQIIFEHSISEWSEWATAFLAFAGLGTLVVEFERGIRERRKEAKETDQAGRVPRYGEGLGSDVPSDTEVFHQYSCRLTSLARSHMLLNGVPLLFAIQPERLVAFSVIGYRALQGRDDSR